MTVRHPYWLKYYGTMEIDKGVSGLIFDYIDEKTINNFIYKSNLTVLDKNDNYPWNFDFNWVFTYK